MALPFPFSTSGPETSMVPGVAGEGSNMTGTNLGVSELMQMLRGLTSDSSRLIQNQSVIPQGGMQPMPKRIYPEMQQSSNREFTTSGGHKRASMMDLGANVASMLKSANQNLENRKARDLSVDIERVMIAAQNPQDPQNQQVLKDIMGDPKKVKALSEALNIKLMGEEDKRKPHQKAALDMATQKLSKQQKQQQQQEQFQQGAPGRVQQLLKSLPNAAMLSPYAQAMITLTEKGVLPKSADVLKAQTELDKDATREKIAELVVNKQVSIADVKAAAQIKASGNYADSRKYVADIMFKARKYEADSMVKRQQMIDDRIAKIVQGKTGNAALDKQVGELKKVSDALKGKIADLNTKWIQAEKAKDSSSIQTIGQEMYRARKEQQQVIQKMEELTKVGASLTSQELTGAGNANTGSGANAGLGGTDQPQDNTNTPDELDKLIDQESQSIFGDSD